MDSLPKRLKELRKKAGLEQTEVAKTIGVTVSTISNWETGVKKPTKKNELKLLALYKVSYEVLHGGISKQELENARVIKIIGKAKAGGLVHMYKKEQDLTVSEDAKLDNAVGALVEGDSMLPFKPNSLLLINRKIHCHCLCCSKSNVHKGETKVKNGDFVYVKLKDGQVFFKVYYELNPVFYTNMSKETREHVESFMKKHNNKYGMIMLEPINKLQGFTPIFISVNEIEECFKVVGVLF